MAHAGARVINDADSQILESLDWLSAQPTLALETDWPAGRDAFLDQC